MLSYDFLEVKDLGLCSLPTRPPLDGAFASTSHEESSACGEVGFSPFFSLFFSLSTISAWMGVCHSLEGRGSREKRHGGASPSRIKYLGEDASWNPILNLSIFSSACLEPKSFFLLFKLAHHIPSIYHWAVSTLLLEPSSSTNTSTIYSPPQDSRLTVSRRLTV